MKYLLFLALISTQASARDCLKDALRLTQGLKLTYAINDLMDRFEEQGKSLSVCDDQDKNAMWESERKAFTEGFQTIRKRALTTGYLEEDFLNFGSSAEAKKIPVAQLCPAIKAKIQKEADCYLPRSYLNGLLDVDITQVTFRDHCRKSLPVLHQNYQRCRKK